MEMQEISDGSEYPKCGYCSKPLFCVKKGHTLKRLKEIKKVESCEHVFDETKVNERGQYIDCSLCEFKSKGDIYQFDVGIFRCPNCGASFEILFDKIDAATLDTLFTGKYLGKLG